MEIFEKYVKFVPFMIKKNKIMINLCLLVLEMRFILKYSIESLVNPYSASILFADIA